MIDEGKDIEVKCHFCNTAYHYTVDELKELLKKSREILKVLQERTENENDKCGLRNG